MSLRKHAGATAVLGAIAFGGVVVSTVPVAAQDPSDDPYITPDALAGTIWFSEEPHRRVTVSNCGDVEVKEGKEIYFHFVERVDDIFVIEVRWWNEQAGLNVLEYGVLAQIEPNEYHYIEADHDVQGDSESAFPGIIGQGTFELLSADEAKLIQVGHLIDGSASGFTTILSRVEELPEAPLEQSYPSFCPAE